MILRREQWHELCYTEKELTFEECVHQAAAKLQKKIDKADHIDIVSSDRTVNRTNSGVRVTEHVTFLKEISEERQLQVAEKSGETRSESSSDEEETR